MNPINRPPRRPNDLFLKGALMKSFILQGWGVWTKETKRSYFNDHKGAATVTMAPLSHDEFKGSASSFLSSWLRCDTDDVDYGLH